MKENNVSSVLRMRPQPKQTYYLRLLETLKHKLKGQLSFITGIAAGGLLELNISEFKLAMLGTFSKRVIMKIPK